STSSSEPSVSLGRVAAWCLAFLLLVRFAFAGCGLDAVQRPVLVSATAALSGQEQPPIRVLAFGSSRMHAAFDAAQWDALAGFPRGSSLNLALTNGVPFDALHVVRAAGVPSTTELVLVEVSHWAFNQSWQRTLLSGSRRQGVPREVRQWGTLRDRLAIPDARVRLWFLADLAWPLYERRGIGRWASRLTEPWRPAPDLSPSRAWDPATARRRAEAEQFEPRTITRLHFREPEVSQFELYALDALLERLAASEARVVLVRLPARARYRTLAATLPGASAFRRQVDREIADRLVGGVSLSACRQGARDYTRWLYRTLAAQAQ
ncbi:MAG: hypothetical protein JRG76_14505, partial [Deltaproteobacteria bacterium]|nr:hypothetical protein [Deltaproteobacteria bacterium]